MFPGIQTKRCSLRKICATDQQKIFEGLSHECVIKYYGVSYKTLEETKVQMDWYEHLWNTKTGIWWAITFRDESDLIGACGFNNISREHKKAEMGYWLLPHKWNSGIMLEVIPEIIKYAFDILTIHRVEATVEKGNNSSIKLLNKLNFENEGTLKECEFKNGKFIDLGCYALLNPYFADAK